MHRPATRPLPVLVVAAALAIAVTAPAQGFTPPIGSNKGSVTGTPPSGYVDMSSPDLLKGAAGYYDTPSPY